MRSSTWLNRIDRIPISTSCNFFSVSSFEKNSKVKRAWPRAILGWVTDREVGTGCARVRTKCAEKTSVGLWGQSRYPIKLPGVTPPGPRSGRGVTSGIRADPRGYMGVCGSVADMWSMARVARSGHGMAHVPTLDAQMRAKRERSWGVLDRCGHRSSKGWVYVRSST